MAQPIKAKEISNAARELAKMRGSLRGWLKYRLINDEILSGKRATKKIPPGLAKKIILQSRDPEVEAGLAERLHVLLSEVMPDAKLPSPLSENAAVALAMIAIHGSQQASQPVPTQGLVLPPWPVLVVAGVLILGVVAIQSYADVAKERERYACIRAGACTDYGFWLKAGGAVVLAWFVWEKTPVGATVKRKLGMGSKTTTPAKR